MVRSVDQWILVRTARDIRNGRKVYSVLIPDHGTDITLMYLALGFGKGDAYTHKFLVEKVANKWITNVPQAENPERKSYLLVAHSIIVSPTMRKYQSVQCTLLEDALALGR